MFAAFSRAEVSPFRDAATIASLRALTRRMSTPISPPITTPYSAARRAIRAAPAHATKALVGVQPVLTQVPPTRWRSTTATFIPAPARRNAKDGPAWPVPMMIASKSGMTSLSSVNEFNQTGSGRGEIVRRTHDAHAAPGVEHEQVIVTADDRLGSGREGELEILIVLWITAIADPHGRLKPDGSMAQYSQDPLTPCQ